MKDNKTTSYVYVCYAPNQGTLGNSFRFGSVLEAEYFKKDLKRKIKENNLTIAEEAHVVSDLKVTAIYNFWLGFAEKIVN